MIPATILTHLGRLRRRERLLQLTWGLARVVAIVLLLLLLGGAIDYLVDRVQETPAWLRQTILGVQIVATLAALVAFLVWPAGRSLGDDELALWVEAKAPRLAHRLISAVQLNRHGADRQGMSEELIVVVTREAEQMAQTIPVGEILDNRRLGLSAALLVPIGIFAVLPFLFWPDTASVLLARQFQSDEEIPRRVHLADQSEPVWPLGESILLKVEADGAEDGMLAVIYLRTPGEPEERYELDFVRQDPQTGRRLFQKSISPRLGDFQYRAYIGDGRFKAPIPIKLVPRPVVVEQTAWGQLPAFTGLKPNGLRYEQLQSRGEVAGILGSQVRVQAKIQKPVKSVVLEVLGPDESVKDEDAKKPEVFRRQVPAQPLHPHWRVRQDQLVPIVLASQLGLVGTPELGWLLASQAQANARAARPEDGTWVEANFELLPSESAYRIVATDVYGFANQPPPRRSLKVIPEDSPAVTLLPELFQPPKFLLKEGDPDEFQVDGLPLIPGAPIKIGYVAHGPYGLGRAHLLFRVLRKKESGNEEGDDVPWQRVPLQEVVGSDETGPFDPRRGVFVNSGENDSIGFHAVPSFQPYQVLGRTLGGGRYIFKTGGIVDEKFQKVELRAGDQLEYCIEVFADKNPNAGRPSTRSESRVKNVIEGKELFSWMRDVLQEERRLRQLDQQQRAVFEGKKD